MMKRVEANAAKSMTQLLGCCYAKGGIWSHIIFRWILFEGADEKVGGIWSHIIFRRILFEGADPNIHIMAHKIDQPNSTLKS
jgi:hypothetical protein